jgi:hypothetical protein
MQALTVREVIVILYIAFKPLKGLKLFVRKSAIIREISGNRYLNLHHLVDDLRYAGMVAGAEKLVAFRPGVLHQSFVLQALFVFVFGHLELVVEIGDVVRLEGAASAFVDMFLDDLFGKTYQLIRICREVCRREV